MRIKIEILLFYISNVV